MTTPAAMIPIGVICEQVKQRNIGGFESNLLSLSYGQVVRRDIDSNDGLLPASFEGYTVVQPGDLVLRLTDMQNDQRSLRTGLVRERGIITSAYLSLRPRSGIDPEYFALAMHAMDITKVMYGLGGGLRQSLTFDDLKSLQVPVPALDVQRQVHQRCTRSISAIDRLTALREKQRDLLEERRVARLAERLHGYPRVPLRRLLRESLVGIVIQPSALYTDDLDGIPALRGLDVKEGVIQSSGHVRLTREGHQANRRSHLNQGDVVVVRTGDAGAAAVVPSWATGWNAIDLVLLRANTQAVPEYIEVVVNAARHSSNVAASASGSIQQHFGVGAVRALPVPLAPLSVQRRIAAETAQERQACADLRAALTDGIERLGELRSAMVVSAFNDLVQHEGMRVIA